MLANIYTYYHFGELVHVGLWDGVLLLSQNVLC
jgi:hypothetical protein